MTPVTYSMPAAITPEMIRALKAHPDTQIEDRDEWHTRLGWLISAWDVLIEHRLPAPEGSALGNNELQNAIDMANAMTKATSQSLPTYPALRQHLEALLQIQAARAAQGAAS